MLLSSLSIPKKVGAVLVKDFCRISLVSSIYKIIAKILANRLKTVLEISFQGLRMLLLEVIRS
jgi:precorrin-3B methylase